MSRWNHIINSVISGIYEATKWYTLIYVCAIMLVAESQDIRVLWVSSIILIVESLFKKQLSKYWGYIIIAIVSIFSSYLLWNNDILLIIIGSLYFLWIQYYMIYRREDNIYFDDEIKQIGVVLAACAVVTMFARNPKYTSAVNTNGIFYLCFSVFFMIRLHLSNEYDSAAYSISKHRNILLMDILMIVFAVTFIILGKNILYYIPNVVLSVLYIFFMSLQLLWKFSLWLVMNIQQLYLFLTGYAQGVYNPGEKVNLDVIVWVEEQFINWDQIDLLPDTKANAYVLPTIIVAITVLGAAILMIYFILVFYQKRHRTSDTITAESEKSFIFNVENVMEQIKEHFKKYVSTTSNNEIRKAYVRAVNTLTEKGVPIKKYMTPNEYVRIVIAENMDENSSFSELTAKYNEVRYKDNI